MNTRDLGYVLEESKTWGKKHLEEEVDYRKQGVRRTWTFCTFCTISTQVFSWRRMCLTVMKLSRQTTHKQNGVKVQEKLASWLRNRGGKERWMDGWCAEDRSLSGKRGRQGRELRKRGLRESWESWTISRNSGYMGSLCRKKVARQVNFRDVW